MEKRAVRDVRRGISLALFICAGFLCVAILAACASAPVAPPVNVESNRAKTIVQGTSTPDFPAGPVMPQTPNTASAIVQQQSGQGQTPPQTPGQPSPVPVSASTGLNEEEKLFLGNYLSRLSYMVYFNEKGGVDPTYAKMAVSQANRYLIEKLGLSVIDFDQIEKNKKDQLDAYQAETRGSIDMIQYLAQKFNADVYVEIDLRASASGSSGSYSASAQGSLKLFETSTATMIGSIAFMSPPTFSPVSADSAITNAITASVWQAMPKVTDQAKTLLGASMARGIRYELLIQNTPDPKVLGQFVKALSRKAKEVEQLSYSPSEARFAVFAFQTKAKLQEAVFDAAETAAMSDMYLVYMRGKSFTFNSGM